MVDSSYSFLFPSKKGLLMLLVATLALTQGTLMTLLFAWAFLAPRHICPRCEMESASDEHIRSGCPLARPYLDVDR